MCGDSHQPYHWCMPRFLHQVIATKFIANGKFLFGPKCKDELTQFTMFIHSTNTVWGLKAPSQRDIYSSRQSQMIKETSKAINEHLRHINRRKMQISATIFGQRWEEMSKELLEYDWQMKIFSFSPPNTIVWRMKKRASKTKAHCTDLSNFVSSVGFL